MNVRLAGAAIALAATAVGCPSQSVLATRPWWGGVPEVMDANGDGVEDMIAVDNHVAVLDGRTYRAIWERGDLEVRRHVAAAGGAVVVVPSSDRSLEILDAATGRTRTKIALTDKVASLCTDGDRVWVSQIDLGTGLLDPRSGTFDTTAGEPPRCAKYRPRRPTECEGSTAECESHYPSKNLLLHDESSFAAVEFKDPGTPEVTIVLQDRAKKPLARIAFDPEGRKVHAVDLAGGKLFIRQSGTVTALDAKSGARQWTSTCVGDSTHRQIRATRQRVYVDCDGPKSYAALRVLDQATGTVLGELGHPRR